MAEPSLYKEAPTVAVVDGRATLNTDTVGVAVTLPQPAWERYLKQGVAVLVIGCGSALPFLSPTSDSLAFKACSIVVAVGAGLGITSRGNLPKQ